MNYIKQLNGFWLQRRLKPLTGRQADLYYAILQCFNESHWQVSLVIPNLLLMSMCTMAERELLRNRLTLVENGLIEYRSGGRNSSGKYRIIPLYQDDVGDDVGSDVCRNVDNNLKEKKKNTYYKKRKKEKKGRLMKKNHFGDIDRWIKAVGVPLDEQEGARADE
ncbi:MAG: hypothetical protein PHN35_06870 [Clostridia bacterium]|nr:hypothetical protein [Clostridia bacterium]